jgi:molecular chaperone HscB
MPMAWMCCVFLASDMEDYFALYDLPRQFYPDLPLLRRQFLRISRESHPDYHVQAVSGQRLKAEELSSLNNRAYAALSDWDARIAHILSLEGVLPAEGESQVAADFLMEMMDLNEVLMELEMDPDPARAQSLRRQLQTIEDDILEAVKESLLAYDRGDQTALGPVCDYYLKRKYLARMLANLETLAS